MEEDHPEKRKRRPRILGLSERPELMDAPEDSAHGCRERAEADLRRSGDDLPINARQILQASARHWLARAELLERLERGSDARKSNGPEDDQE